MTNEISKKIQAVVMKNGIEVWLEGEKLENFKKVLRALGGQSRFLEINDEGINTAEIVGWFTLKTMEDYAKRKNGQFKCQYGTWHQRGDVCNCAENVKYEKFSYKIKR